MTTLYLKENIAHPNVHFYLSSTHPSKEYRKTKGEPCYFREGFFQLFDKAPTYFSSKESAIAAAIEMGFIPLEIKESL